MKFRNSYATLLIVLFLSSILAGCSGSSNSSEKELEGGWLVYDDLLDNDSENQYFYRYLLFEPDGFVGTDSWDSKDRCQEKYGEDGIWLESEELCFPPDRRWESWKVLDEMRMTWTSTNDIPLNENDCMEYGSFDGLTYTSTASWQNESQICIETYVSEKILSSKKPILCLFLIYSLPGLPKPIINFSLLFIITILYVNFYKL